MSTTQLDLGDTTPIRKPFAELPDPFLSPGVGTPVYPQSTGQFNAFSATPTHDMARSKHAGHALPQSAPSSAAYASAGPASMMTPMTRLCHGGYPDSAAHAGFSTPLRDGAGDSRLPGSLASAWSRPADASPGDTGSPRSMRGTSKKRALAARLPGPAAADGASAAARQEDGAGLESTPADPCPGTAGRGGRGTSSGPAREYFGGADMPSRAGVGAASSAAMRGPFESPLRGDAGVPGAGATPVSVLAGGGGYSASSQSAMPPTVPRMVPGRPVWHAMPAGCANAPPASAAMAAGCDDTPSRLRAQLPQLKRWLAACYAALAAYDQKSSAGSAQEPAGDAASVQSNESDDKVTPVGTKRGRQSDVTPRPADMAAAAAARAAVAASTASEAAGDPVRSAARAASVVGSGHANAEYDGLQVEADEAAVTRMHAQVVAVADQLFAQANASADGAAAIAQLQLDTEAGAAALQHIKIALAIQAVIQVSSSMEFMPWEAHVVLQDLVLQLAPQHDENCSEWLELQRQLVRWMAAWGEQLVKDCS